MTLISAFVLMFLVLAPEAEAQRSWTLDDFDDGDLVASTRLAWIVVSDGWIGGQSKAELATFGAGDHGNALRMTGVVSPGGVMGAWVALEPSGRAADMSAFDGVSVRLRGEGEWTVGVRGGNFINYLAPVTGTTSWKEIRVPFTDLKPTGQSLAAKTPPFDPHAARWLGVGAAPGRSGALRVEIDDVKLYSMRPGDAAPAAGKASGVSMEVRVPRAMKHEIARARWQSIATDAAGDGVRPTLPDAVLLSGWDDAEHGLIWFRIQTAAPVPPVFGANIALDVDGDPSTGVAWWGKNTDFKFDRLVTAWVNWSDADVLQGTIGIADAGPASRGELIEPAGPRPRVMIDSDAHAIVIGVPRAALKMGKGRLRVLGAVGSPFMHNDDVPGQGAAVFLR